MTPPILITYVFSAKTVIFSVDNIIPKNTLKMDLEEILTKVGLDEKRAKIYVALLDLGQRGKSTRSPKRLA